MHGTHGGEYAIKLVKDHILIQARDKARSIGLQAFTESRNLRTQKSALGEGR
jgi:hypothetical protein